MKLSGRSEKLFIPLGLLLVASTIILGKYWHSDATVTSTISFDRARIIDRSREIASLLGYETADWKVRITTREFKADQIALTNALNSPALHYLSPYLNVVYLIDATTNDTIIIELTNKGVLRRFEYLKRLTRLQLRRGPDQIPEIPPSESDFNEDRNRRDTSSLNEFPFDYVTYLRDLSPQLFYTTLTLSDADQDRFQREQVLELGTIQSASMKMMRPVLKFGFNGKRVSRIEFIPGLTPEVRRMVVQMGDWRLVWLKRAQTILVWPMLLITLIFGLIAIAFHRFQWRESLPLWGGLFLAICLSDLAGEKFDLLINEINFSQLGDLFEGSGWLSSTLPSLSYLLWLLWTLILSLLGYSIYVTGVSLAIRTRARRSIGIELLARGRFLTEPVVEGVVFGIISGVVVVALPLLLEGKGVEGRSGADAVIGLEMIVGRGPALAALSLRNLIPYFTYFAVICPLLEMHVGRTRYRWPLMFGLTIFMVAQLPTADLPFIHLLIGSGLIGAVLLYTYHQANLLGVMIGLLTGDTLNRALLLLNQNVPSLKTAGLRVIGGLISLFLVSLVAWRFKRPASKRELSIPARLLENTIERERLKADFEVARRAQASLLPTESPILPGYEVSASCLPSREVGGDLYDFIPLFDHQMWFVVADVSGKGVPAALYMTLTKGLLAALTGRTQSPTEILHIINQHLYEVCRRKVFVTMILGRLDSINHRMLLARAGHNPAVHHRAATGENRVLNPRGIGLGLSQSSLFDTALTIESVDLEPGDVLVFYSDGITEAMNRENEEFGVDRVIQIIEEQGEKSARQIREAIQLELTRFLQGLSPQDDQTLLIIKRSTPHQMA